MSLLQVLVPLFYMLQLAFNCLLLDSLLFQLVLQVMAKFLHPFEFFGKFKSTRVTFNTWFESQSAARDALLAHRGAIKGL